MGGASTKPKDFCCSQATWFLDPIGVGGGHLMSLNTIESLSLFGRVGQAWVQTGLEGSKIKVMLNLSKTCLIACD
jgi:hypothetical protein